MPLQYQAVRQGRLRNEVEALLKDRVVNCLDVYFQAVIPSQK
jgi:tagatose-1,6-bisphosphate aldolase non-catalytic subunit AgaZ/GatZ